MPLNSSGGRNTGFFYFSTGKPYKNQDLRTYYWGNYATVACTFFLQIRNTVNLQQRCNSYLPRLHNFITRRPLRAPLFHNCPFYCSSAIKLNGCSAFCMSDDGNCRRTILLYVLYFTLNLH